jgi:hypothetical protein
MPAGRQVGDYRRLLPRLPKSFVEPRTRAVCLYERFAQLPHRPKLSHSVTFSRQFCLENEDKGR